MPISNIALSAVDDSVGSGRAGDRQASQERRGSDRRYAAVPNDFLREDVETEETAHQPYLAASWGRRPLRLERSTSPRSGAVPHQPRGGPLAIASR